MATSSSDADVAARLIERLLVDSMFRAKFRRDPAAACREAGLDQLAQEMSIGGGKAMYTLDMRESKSSLAGVMMAAAMEGVGIYQFSEHVLPHLEHLPHEVSHVVSRVHLPAIKGALRGGGGGGGSAADVTDTPAVSSPNGAPAVDPALANGSLPASTPPPSASALPAEITPQAPKAADALPADVPKSASATPTPDAAPKSTPAQDAADKIAQQNSPAAAQQQQVQAASNVLDSQSSSDSNLPDASLPGSGDPTAAADPTALPSGGDPTAAAGATAPPAGVDPSSAPVSGAPAGVDPTALPSGGDPTAATPTGTSALPAVTATPATGGGSTSLAADTTLPSGDPTAAVDPTALPTGGAVHAAIDASQFGVGHSGTPDAETLALTHNPNVTFDPAGLQDLQAGRIDPRVVAVLTKLGQDHKITVSAMCSEQPAVPGDMASTYQGGRGVDITAIDGQAVTESSVVARDVAGELSSLDPSMRPDEIGSPFSISSAGYFTDPQHINHLSIGFKDQIAPDWQPPAEVAAVPDPSGAAASAAAADPTPVAAPATPAPAVAAVAPVAAAPVTPAPVAPPEIHTGSQAFLKAVSAQDAAAHQAKVRAGDSQAFLKAVKPDPPAASSSPVATAASVQPGGAGVAVQPTGSSLDVAAAAASAAPDAYPGDNAPREQIAAWLAGQAQKRGLPPQLPVMASLVESGMTNIQGGDRDSVGFFQMRTGIWDEGPYKGFQSDPSKQVAWFLDQAEAAKKQRIAEGKSVTDPNQYGDWIADVERPAEQYRGRYQLRLDQANGLLKGAVPSQGAGATPVSALAAADPSAAPVAATAAAVVEPATAGADGGSPLGASALSIAETQKGVREVGSSNTGVQVDQYLNAAGVAPGNPWCASFVTWSLEKAGHKMPGGGWAAVATWVHNAQQNNDGLQIVKPEDARPGDLVAYDWGGGNDFSSDGHIGFLASKVDGGGQFTALEGNNDDAVNQVARHLGGGPNIVFIRVNGDASASAAAAAQAAATTPAGGAAPVAVAASVPGAPAATPVAAAAVAQPVAPALVVPQGSQAFLKAVSAQDAAAHKAHVAGDSQAFLKAVAPKPAAPPVASAAVVPQPPPPTAAVAPEQVVSAPAAPAGAVADAVTAAPVAGGYPGDSASKEALAAWMGAEAQKRGLPPELPAMASLVESSMTNIQGGDRDSVGFFQMRTGIWDEGPYAGFEHDPEKQLAWFLDQAEAVKKQRIANGQSVTDPNQYGDWVADVERPQENLRFKYGLQLGNAQELLKHAPAAVDQAPAPAAAPAVAEQVVSAQPAAAAAHHVDPAQYGVSGTGGAPDPEALALLKNKNIVMTPDEIADVQGGRIDPRVVGLLTQLGEHHKLTIAALCSDHSNFTAAGAVSDHSLGRAVDISAIDGEPVGPGSAVARDIAGELSSVESGIRPDEIGSPWAISGAGYFTDAAHSNHLHIGFKEAISPDWQAPADVRAPGDAAAAAATPAPAAVADVTTSPAASAQAVVTTAPAAGITAQQLADAHLPAEVLQPLEAAITSGNPPGPKALAAIEEASKHIGTPYQWGGSTPQTGFDCSGLMQWSYAQAGIQIPRVTYTQIDAANGIAIDRSHLKPGDLVFFAAAGDVHHVGMYLGNDQFLHAPHTGDVVKVSSLDEPYYASQFDGGRRFDQTADAASAAATPDVSAAAAAPAVAAPVVAPEAVVPAPAVPVAAAASGPAVDPTDVAKAQVAVARDAAEARRHDSQLFQAITAQESRKTNARNASVMFLKAIDPSQIKRTTPPAVPAVPVTPAPAPVAPAAPVAAAASVTPPAAAADVTTPGGQAEAVSAVSNVDFSAAAGTYPGDNASQAQLAQWLAGQAQKAGLPPELPVMASLVESDVKNLDYGDRDSVGFFQMRTETWNQGAYAGFPQRPELQAKWFIDQALAVKRQAIASGDASFGTDPSKYGEWIANIERPAEQYRGRYQLRLDQARGLLGGTTT